MAVESFTFISSLSPDLPASSDGLVEGDNHLRGIKLAVKQSFPNVTGAVTSTHTQLSNPLLSTTLAANKVPYYNSTTTATTFDVTAFGLSMANAATASAALTLLGADAKYVPQSTPIATNITTTGTVQAAAFTVSSTAPSIVFADTDWSNRTLHMNSGTMGFLKSDGNWGFYSDNGGNTSCPGTAYAANFYISSDPRLKKDIRPITKEAAEAFVRNVRGYVYRMIDTNTLTSGVLSTEVKMMVPALVTSHDEYERVNYDGMTPYLLVHANSQTERQDQTDLLIRTLRDEISELRRIIEMTVAPTTGAPQ